MMYDADSDEIFVKNELKMLVN